MIVIVIIIMCFISSTNNTCPIMSSCMFLINNLSLKYHCIIIDNCTNIYIQQQHYSYANSLYIYEFNVFLSQLSHPQQNETFPDCALFVLFTSEM